MGSAGHASASSATYRGTTTRHEFGSFSNNMHRSEYQFNLVRKCITLTFCLLLVVAYGCIRVTRGPLGIPRSGSSIKVNFDIQAPLSPNELKELNTQLSNANVDEILRWAHDQFPNKLVQLTSFGPTGMVVLHKLYQLGILSDVPVVTIDTLHLFPETYNFMNDVGARYKAMKLSVHSPNGFYDRPEFDEHYSSNLWKTNPDKYAYLSKLEPMERAMEDMRPSALLTGRRKTQGGEREKLTIVEVDNLDNRRFKINPLVEWTYDDVWSYIRKHKIPYNPLHDRGYKSIGDVMTTVPIDPNADERSGRFVGLNKTECGMHSHLEKIHKMKEEAEKNKYEFITPTLECTYCEEADATNFDEIVLNAKRDILLEFYSPYCSGCQEMAPIYDKIAFALHSLYEKITVVRFDITENEIPQSGKDVGMDVEVTPSLYLVQHSTPSIEVALFEGGHDFGSLMEWLELKTSYITPSAMQV